MIKVNKEWSLLLDRDGVINIKLENDYVKNWSEFRPTIGIINVLQKLSNVFGRILVFTNQQGIGKGIMTENDLAVIHQNMLALFEEHHIKIDGIYYCPHLESDDCVCRKPRAGLAVSAVDDFPEIDFKKSIMLGDSISDMEFGKSIKATTIMLSSEPIDNVFIDYNIKSFDELLSLLSLLTLGDE
ncbi:MAG: hypothetical protein A2Y40_10670 [Candidatus Margulisbacteria bacterium GWF2_35_9]|nr:MAG: hypothetical protein A2Y40_10670 [Candidatus Margulisbacteria bacterium GWF2_35_9]